MDVGDHPARTLVLVVEDDAELCRAIARCLEQRCCRVVTVDSVGPALELADHFDIGIFDLNLPDGFGVGAARELLARGTLGRAVFFTAAHDPPLLRAARELGPIITKSSGVSNLIDTIGLA